MISEYRINGTTYKPTERGNPILLRCQTCWCLVSTFGSDDWAHAEWHAAQEAER